MTTEGNAPAPGPRWLAKASGRQPDSREPMQPADFRAVYDDAASDLEQPRFDEEPNVHFKEAVSWGEAPWDIWARTYVKTEDDAKRLARRIALNKVEFERHEIWRHAPWVQAPVLVGAYMLYSNFMRNLSGFSVRQGVMMEVGMLMGEGFDVEEVRKADGSIVERRKPRAERPEA